MISAVESERSFFSAQADSWIEADRAHDRIRPAASLLTAIRRKAEAREASAGRWLAVAVGLPLGMSLTVFFAIFISSLTETSPELFATLLLLSVSVFVIG